MSDPKDANVKVRRLRPDDLERTIAIDQAHQGCGGSIEGVSVLR